MAHAASASPSDPQRMAFLLDPDRIERISMPLALGFAVLAVALLMIRSVSYDPAGSAAGDYSAAASASAELPREWSLPQRAESFEQMYRHGR